MSLMCSTGAMAMGGASDTSSSSEPKGAAPQGNAAASDPVDQDLTTCRKGEIWSTRQKKCVKMRSEALPADEMTHYAYALAKAERYDEALVELDLLADPNTPEALNYRGYATRKLGRTDEGIGYYLKSLNLAPHYAQVREYLGEAYVIKGRIDLAKDQLSTIATICGRDCEPYRDLSEAIEHAPTL
ncbi:tetratricopeptide repeat protein [Lichenifustis flavocetrariae]|uniref:tetratricopeptide repeat protein n=1 Tax=Lichenifustis flavocetrariae TaxID=2949735 RepID=UPI003D13229E